MHTPRGLMLTFLLSVSFPAGAETFPETYSFEPGFDRPGSDYATFEQTGDYQSPELCRDACFSQPRCVAYTFVRPGVAGPSAFCRLKDAEPAPVESDCCISAVKGGKPRQEAISSLRLHWLGWDEDKVGKDRNPAPDGAPDHRFVIEISLPADQQLAAITLRPSDSQGMVLGSLVWSSEGKDGELLAVEMDGQRLNSPAGKPLDLAGELKLDLHAHDIGQWNVDSHVSVEAKLRNGKKLTHWFRLKSPPDRLLGTWQMHCSNSAPHHFEPWTFSGRIQLTVREDGSVGGVFGAMPVTGRSQTDGAISGTASDGKEYVEWRGTLQGADRGKPLRGEGTFRYVKSESGCLDQGVWFTR